MAEIAVVGSLNVDTTLRVARLPGVGETVPGTSIQTDTGGKGANQAVAAARLGREVAMVGAVGYDEAGDRLLSALGEAGVGVESVSRTGGSPTGQAFIVVDDTAENTIVVVAGANGTVAPGDLEAALLEEAEVTMLQLEIPLDTVAAAAAASRGMVVLNPAPAMSLDDALLAEVDVLVPNETELADLAGGPVPSGPDEAAAAARSLHGPGAVVVTIGAAGAVVVEGGSSVHLPAPPVRAVDPTAAGDAFCAGLADGLVRGLPLVEAARWAVFCGAVTVTRPGAQASLPDRDEVERLEAAT
jgi:ribokinase